VLLQAKDRRFCNAGVEFNLVTLRPTYRLMWQSVGASNALAVAEGLGFDPPVIKEARQVPHPRCDASPVRLY
jgi:DNA mismatch repair protein MutS2